MAQGPYRQVSERGLVSPGHGAVSGQAPPGVRVVVRRPPSGQARRRVRKVPRDGQHHRGQRSARQVASQPKVTQILRLLSQVQVSNITCSQSIMRITDITE